MENYEKIGHDPRDLGRILKIECNPTWINYTTSINTAG